MIEGDYDQGTLYACMEMLQQTPHFVQLTYNNLKQGVCNTRSEDCRGHCWITYTKQLLHGIYQLIATITGNLSLN
jgi:hypothetical protein